MKTFLPTLSALMVLAASGTTNAPGDGRAPLAIASAILSPGEIWETEDGFPAEFDDGLPPEDGILIEDGDLPPDTRPATEDELRRFAARWSPVIDDWTYPADARFTYGIRCLARVDERKLSQFEEGYSSLALACPRDPTNPRRSLPPSLGYVDVVERFLYTGAPRRVEVRGPHRWLLLIYRARPSPPLPVLAANPEP
jgi:hypothetical protein